MRPGQEGGLHGRRAIMKDGRFGILAAVVAAGVVSAVILIWTPTFVPCSTCRTTWPGTTSNRSGSRAETSGAITASATGSCRTSVPTSWSRP